MVLRTKKEVCDNWVEHINLQEETENVISSTIPGSSMIRNKVPTWLFSTKVSDFWWMAQCSLSNNVPMWVGWNSTISPDKSPINKIFYLPQTNQLLIVSAVVAETMKRGQQLLKKIERKEFA